MTHKFAPPVPEAPDAAALLPTASEPPAQPLTAFALEQIHAEWLRLQDEIDEALNARDLNRACVLSGVCRRVERVLFSQPFRIGGRRP